MSYYGKALDGTGVLTLYESGIDMDPVGGVKIFSLQEGLQSLYSAITVNSRLISMVVSTDGGQASIKIGDIVDGLNSYSGVQIKASRIDLQGYVTAEELSVTNATIENLTSGITTASILRANSIIVGGLTVGSGSYGASQLIIDGESAGSILTTRGEPVSISHAYFTGCKASTSGSSVTLTFSRGVGDDVTVNFNKAGEVTGAALGDVSGVRSVADGKWVADCAVTVHTSSGEVDLGNKVVDVSTAYRAGWAAACALQSSSLNLAITHGCAVQFMGADPANPGSTTAVEVGAYSFAQSTRYADSSISPASGKWTNVAAGRYTKDCTASIPVIYAVGYYTSQSAINTNRAGTAVTNSVTRTVTAITS